VPYRVNRNLNKHMGYEKVSFVSDMLTAQIKPHVCTLSCHELELPTNRNNK